MPSDRSDDPHDLHSRFIQKQEVYFTRALMEIRQGQKQSHWLWYVLPTAPYIVEGQEQGSEMNRSFALRGDSAKAYLQIKSLRSNYYQICKAIESQLKFGNTMYHLFGPLDQNKVVSSWKLFRDTSSKLGDYDLANLCLNLLNLSGAVREPEKKKYFIV
jgi:uncharacterized protein (DUF1810 family)